MSGNFRRALQFDRGNDYVHAGHNIHLGNSSFTLAAWAKRSATGRWDVIMGQGSGNNNRGLHFGFRSGNTFTCAFWGNDLDTPAYTDTDWHHWACTFDANTKRRIIYRDGVQVEQDYATGVYQGSGDMYLGWAPVGIYYKGLIDEAFIFPTSLSQADIQAVRDGRYRPAGKAINYNQWHHLVATSAR